MAILTQVSEDEVRAFLEGYSDLGKLEAVLGIPEGSVNSNYRLESTGPDGQKRPYFLRIYEEQGFEGARTEGQTLRELSGRGVRCQPPLARKDGGHVGGLAGKPAALFAWCSGNMRCQAGVTERDAFEVGAALARIHLAGGENREGRPGRFGAPELRERLDRIAAAPEPELAAWAAPLRRALDANEARRRQDLPRGLVHGDLFRDNILWNEAGEIVTLLDFESAFQGTFIFDLMVTVLAWCVGDELDPKLARSMVAGYESVRPLGRQERLGLYAEACFAALRFCVTRITDFAMRGNTMKDYRRFIMRHQSLERMGPDGLSRVLFEEEHVPAPIAITMGDPSGIGPEIIVKAALSPEFASLRAFVVGDAGRLVKERDQLGAKLEIVSIGAPEEARFGAGTLEVLPCTELSPDLPYGEVSAEAGRAAFTYLSAAIALAKEGRASAICTAPLNKEALARGGVHHPGHTEILAEQTGSDVAMMLITPELRTMLVTIHCSLRDAIAQLTVEAELRIIRLAHASLKQIGIAAPRIAVAGLNPHAGEGRLFGDEDALIIRPAVEQAQREGIDVQGPLPGDTVFASARRGRFDLVVAQYHDQGLIPIKLLGVEHGVNVTAGLPFVRTSPDHGTAFDIAGKGIADATSMLYALEMARSLRASSGESR